MNKCLYCDTETNNPRFCSQSHAAKYNNSRRKSRSIESRQKTRSSVLRTIKDRPISYYYEGPVSRIRRKTCTHCKQDFWSTTDVEGGYYPKTCSDYCRHSKTSINSVVKKQIPYYCKASNTMVKLQSSWEERMAIWLDDNNIKWIRPSKIIIWFDEENKRRRYLPDFYLLNRDIYLDPKNPIGMIQQKYKLTEVRKQITLFAGEIQDIIESIGTLDRI